MPLSRMPTIERLTLATVTRVPQWHPDHATFRPFPVHAWVVRHPDGPILVDTGIGVGSALIDEFYAPVVIPLDAALGEIGIGTDDVAAVVLSHLHFDHCGQHRMLAAPVFVQATEYDAARAPRYSVPEWCEIPQRRLRLLDGNDEVASGVRILSTPGHTPGHQSVVIEVDDERVVLAAQCAFHADEVRSGDAATSNLHDETWRDAARTSLARLRGLGPSSIHLSHDPEIVRLT
jgi:glyoxylase-like metal-dependent hydrolase (beta-lactamase superfamily II)